ncbi:MAG: hypothetical protein ACI9KE_000974 [Polyangiales bacterium]|jgi:hypothetical protein
MFSVLDAQQNAAPLPVSLFRYAPAFTTGPFNADDVRHARARIWRRAQLSCDGDPTRLLAEAFARSLTPTELEARYQALESLTPDDLLVTARRYFAPERMIVFVGAPSRRRPRFNIVREERGFRLVEEVR